jgi:hypothetical protein
MELSFASAGKGNVFQAAGRAGVGISERIRDGYFILYNLRFAGIRISSLPAFAEQ